MNIFNLKTFLSILLFMSLSPLFGDTIASVNQTTVYEGDPIILTIESSQNTHQPDLSPLEQDFDIISSSTSSQINIINGQQSFKKSWTIELLARELGQYDIPAIRVGNETTIAIPLNIMILPPEVKAETGKHITIESFIGSSKSSKASASKETYVQQQIPYTVKLLFDSSMLSGEISEPSIENTVVEKLGRDKRYNVRKAGKKFSVIEQHYVISPEKSGTLTIPPTTIKGKIALSSNDSKKLRRRMDDTDLINRFFNDLNGFRNDPFFNDPFDNGFFRSRSRTGPNKPFTITTEPIEVNVLPVPVEFTGKNWLPADALSLTDSWAKKPPELKVGEPVTRTLTLQAKGLAGSQIPELTIPKPENMKIYPEPANAETRTDGQTVYGVQQVDVSYIPNKSGDITIPEIKLDWWNLKTKKQQTLVLPKWTLQVEQGTAVEESSSSKAIKTAEETNKTNTDDTTPDTSVDKIGSENTNSLNYIFGAFLIIGIAIIGYFVYRRIKHQSGLSKDEPNSLVDISTLKKAALEACEKNDNHSAAQNLLKLIQAQWENSSITNLGILINQTSSDVTPIKELEKSLYAPQSSSWNGEKLHKLVVGGIERKDHKVVSDKEFLKPLYPS